MPISRIIEWYNTLPINVQDKITQCSSCSKDPDNTYGHGCFRSCAYPKIEKAYKHKQDFEIRTQPKLKAVDEVLPRPRIWREQQLDWLKGIMEILDE